VWGRCVPRSDNNDDVNYYYIILASARLAYTAVLGRTVAAESDHVDSRRVWSRYIACMCALVLT
jgi:hypothetical protein